MIDFDYYKDKFIRKFIHPIYKFQESVKNLIRWLPVIWEDREWKWK